MDKRELDISWTSLWRIFLMLLFIVGLYYTSNIVVILLLAIVISSALDAPLNYLESRRIPRILGIVFIFIMMLAVLIILLYTILPIIILEVTELLAHFDKIQSSIGGLLGISKIIGKARINLDTLSAAIFSGSFSFFDIFPHIFSNVILLIALLITSIYLALYRDGIEHFLKAVLPISYENYAISIFHRSRKKIGKWLEGQIFLSLIIGIITFLGLQILGVNYSIVLGVLAAVFEIIPFVGPVIAGAFSFFVASSQSLTLGLYTLIFFVAVQQLEGHLLVPIVMRKVTGIHPVVVVISILVGGEIYGISGAILAVPIVVVLQEIVEDYANRKHRQPTF